MSSLAVVIVLAMFAGYMALAANPPGRRPRHQQKSSEISRAEPSNHLLALGSWSSSLIASSHCSGATDSALGDTVPGRLGSTMFIFDLTFGD